MQQFGFLIGFDFRRGLLSLTFENERLESVELHRFLAVVLLLLGLRTDRLSRFITGNSRLVSVLFALGLLELTSWVV